MAASSWFKLDVWLKACKNSVMGNLVTLKSSPEPCTPMSPLGLDLRGVSLSSELRLLVSPRRVPSLNWVFVSNHRNSRKFRLSRCVAHPPAPSRTAVDPLPHAEVAWNAFCALKEADEASTIHALLVLSRPVQSHQLALLRLRPPPRSDARHPKSEGEARSHTSYFVEPPAGTSPRRAAPMRSRWCRSELSFSPNPSHPVHREARPYSGSPCGVAKNINPTPGGPIAPPISNVPSHPNIWAWS
ncbi:hypothetical protein B0H13DRAFT_1912978 [Mycena leptocephala]|nr:hypothetical protein B0H13DRAFT_1912978 [Mycena leptocephala]